MRASTIWISVTALAIGLTACDGSTETDAGTPGSDGGAGSDGGSAVDGGGGAVDAGTPVDTGVGDTDGGLTLTPGDCTELCEADDDCAETIGCVDDRCTCTTDERCQLDDLWNDEGCTSDEECSNPAYRCVEWDTSTYCVPDDTERFGCGAIGGGGPTKVEVTLADGGGTIQTCVEEDIVCRDDGTCGVLFQCEDDTDCGGNLPHCDVASGRCVCTDDTEDSCTENHPAFQCRTDGACGCLEDSICPSSTGGHCHVDTGTCGCLTDDDCDGEICHEGQCRCATELGCGIVLSPTNPGTTFECIPL